MNFIRRKYKRINTFKFIWVQQNFFYKYYIFLKCKENKT